MEAAAAADAVEATVAARIATAAAATTKARKSAVLAAREAISRARSPPVPKTPRPALKTKRHAAFAETADDAGNSDSEADALFTDTALRRDVPVAKRRRGAVPQSVNVDDALFGDAPPSGWL